MGGGDGGGGDDDDGDDGDADGGDNNDRDDDDSGLYLLCKLTQMGGTWKYGFPLRVEGKRLSSCPMSDP
jgi:hypothetical protein